MYDSRYTNGFDNVLYYGVAEESVENEFVFVTVSLSPLFGNWWAAAHLPF